MTDDARKAMDAWQAETCPHQPPQVFQGEAMDVTRCWWLAPDAVVPEGALAVCEKCLVDLFARLETAEREAADTARARDQARLASIDAANLEAERNDLRADNARLREALRELDAQARAAKEYDIREYGEHAATGWADVILAQTQPALVGTGGSDGE